MSLRRDAPASDRTALGKPHYEVLDGLRGSAALLVVLFHVMGMTVNWSDRGQYLPHAAMAVDFFFGLSGFVIGYAYDERWKTMTTGGFFLARPVRLQPLVVLGAALGLLSFVFDPFASNQHAIPLGRVLADFGLTCVLFPYASLPNRWTDTHSLNSPAWSLMQEYLGNIAYALVLRRLVTWALGLLVAVAGILLIGMVSRSNTMDQGSDWTSLWGGAIRMGFSFPLGLWLYRVKDRLPKPMAGWVVLTVVLAGLFAFPHLAGANPHANGIYEATVVLLLFPAIILCGAHSNLGRMELAICKFAGRMSYPVYILHYPFLLVYMNYVNFRKPSPSHAAAGAATALVVVLLFSWFALVAYDEPIRRILRSLTRGR